MRKVFKTQSFNADDEILNIFIKLKRYKMKRNQFITEAIKIHYYKHIKPYELVYSKKRNGII